MIIVTHAEKCGCGILTQGWLPHVLKVFSAVADLGAYSNQKCKNFHLDTLEIWILD